MKKRLTLTLWSAILALAAFSQEADTTIVLNYGYLPVDTITVSKSSAIFLQLQEAESVIHDLTDQKAKNQAVLDYVSNHPDSDGSVYLLGHVRGIDPGRKILSLLSERARNGNMKKLYHAYSDGVKEFDEMTTKTREACPIGKEAKDFTLEDINGRQLTLSSLRGRYVILDFWGSWCGGCIAEFPHMKNFYEHHRDKLEIVGVAFHDQEDKWKAAVEEHQLPWKLVLDREEDSAGADSVAKRYGIVAAPTYVLIDPEGNIVQWTIGEIDSIEMLFE